MEDFVTAAKELVASISEMPTGYLSGQLTMLTNSVQDAIDNQMTIALNYRCRSLLESVMSYPDFRTERAITAAEKLKTVMPSLTNFAAMTATCPQ